MAQSNSKATTDGATKMPEWWGKADGDNVSQPISVPVGLARVIHGRAVAAGKPTAQYLRELVAQEFKYTLPAAKPRGRKSTLTAAEKDELSNVTKDLLKLARSGGMSVTDIRAKMVELGVIVPATEAAAS